MCIYESEGKCLLDYIEIDTLVHCGECIQVSLDKQTAEKLKEEKRRNLSY